jgi:hypothetical protein
MLLIWGRVKQNSENQKRPAATEWHVGKSDMAGMRVLPVGQPSRFPNRGGAETDRSHRLAHLNHAPLTGRSHARPRPLACTVNHLVCAATQDRFARHLHEVDLNLDHGDARAP